MRAAAVATVQPGTPADFTVSVSNDILRLELTEAVLDRAAQDAADRSLEVIRHRVDQVGVSEPVISRVGQDRILVQMWHRRHADHQPAPGRRLARDHR
jgi:SecD/SecF fusion protein